jgi:uncharacterized protein (DUF1684 family)
MKRRGKDRFFRDHPQSPIPLPDRASFEGLIYYPLNPVYRFELQLHEHDVKRVVRVPTTHGGERELLLWGEFRFMIGEEPCTLQAFRNDPGTGRLFVPFRDGTSGVETYEKGRYLDLEPEIHRTSEGTWVLDFNEAYNPWCEYSNAYTCPFAPPENWLEVPVRAGERSFVGSTTHAQPST